MKLQEGLEQGPSMQYKQNGVYYITHGLVYNITHGLVYYITHGLVYNITNGLVYNITHGLVYNNTHGLVYYITHGLVYNITHGLVYTCIVSVLQKSVCSASDHRNVKDHSKCSPEFYSLNKGHQVLGRICFNDTSILVDPSMFVFYDHFNLRTLLPYFLTIYSQKP